jgi:queuine/archaeosine tRNA-ribosyltransferase
LIERNAPGYAIGGLAGGETKDMFWRVVAQCAAGLPPGKPRYVMGIGYVVPDSVTVLYIAFRSLFCMPTSLYANFALQVPP